MPRPAAPAPLARRQRASALSLSLAAAALLAAAPARAASVTPTRTATPSPTTVSPSSSPSYVPGVISTVAGTGVAGFGGDGSAATSAAIFAPDGVALDNRGNLYIADRNNHRVRRVAADTGTITTVVGTGMPGSLGDSGAATSASVNEPHDVCFDTHGNLFIAEFLGHRVRRVAAGTGVITTVAGTGVQGFGGDGGPATNAPLSHPVFLVMEPSGSLLISEYGGHRVRRVAVSTGVIGTVAGNGVAGFSGDGAAATSARISQPEGLALHLSGDLYIVDYGNHRVRKVSAGTGVISTVAGNGVPRFSGDSGAATSASFSGPVGIAFDQDGNMFIADFGNCRLRKVASGTGIISTAAGNGVCGSSGDGGAATSASLSFPTGIALDSAGTVFVGDRGNHRIRRVSVLSQPSSTPSATPSVTPYCAPSLFRSLPRTDLVGTLVGTALTPGAPALVASEAACRQACCDAPVCEGFAFELAATLHHSSAPCYLYVNVTQLMPTSSFQSGVLESVL